MDYKNFFQNHLENLKIAGNYRVFASLERDATNPPYAWWHNNNQERKRVAVWCSNDYLGMSRHPEVITAFKNGADLYGVGSGGTRNIAGTNLAHVQLEQQIALLHKKDAGLIFSSGYAANETTLYTLGRNIPNLTIFSDEKNHASMIQGICNSHAKKIIFSHNDLNDLKNKLAALPINEPKIIAFVSVYSMDGDFAPIKEICNLAKEFNALTFLDEVHAMGIYGPSGDGVAAQLNCSNMIDIIQGNFAKGYGVVGGYITGAQNLIDYIRSYAFGFIFTTSIPPAVAIAASKSIEVLANAHQLRATLWENVLYIKQQLNIAKINFIDHGSHIIPVVIGNAIKCKMLTDLLLQEYNIYVQPINYPTVPKGQERIRVTITPFHNKEITEHFVQSLKASLKKIVC